MTCFFCRGKKENGLTIDVTDLGSCIVIVREVPCYKCAQCGETTFDLIVGERLEQIVDALKDSISEIAVVQYSSVAA
ncbi:MAG: type II toxin-antitoxin system MqsA family antitoxin [Defluviitaleaceae bacterium]|nr:type II toxin-antitoxin system MqsA family antitoxin [Defluviitaleaceae bacterium]